ncbi:unnamed protein product [Gongylonema pulchrum]|uniref:ShKT domain-containing protein n=1 Tax=Gongylonema pulchrum TaxID=637853 RepID=A0A183DNJ3_9BILA|nr:unnamed protein product [Gongylonema pulchrum]
MLMKVPNVIDKMLFENISHGAEAVFRNTLHSSVPYDKNKKQCKDMRDLCEDIKVWNMDPQDQTVGQFLTMCGPDCNLCQQKIQPKPQQKKQKPKSPPDQKKLKSILEKLRKLFSVSL